MPTSIFRFLYESFTFRGISATVRANYHPESLENLPLSLIIADEGVQPRAVLCQETITDYAQQMADGVQFPPVMIFLDGTYYWLADGFHRFEAAKKAGLSTILAEVRQGGRRDAVLYAVSANAEHGLKRTNQDKRRAVETLLNDPEWCHWSAREIARTCGVSNTFVCNLMRETNLSVNGLQIAPQEGDLSVNGLQIQQQATSRPGSVTQRIVQRNGKIYTLNTANIGRNKSLNSGLDKMQGDSNLAQDQSLGSNVVPLLPPDHQEQEEADAAIDSALPLSQQANELLSQDSEHKSTLDQSPPELEDSSQLSSVAPTERAIQLQLRFDEAKSFFNHFDQTPVCTGEISEVLEVKKDRLRAIVEISLQSA